MKKLLLAIALLWAPAVQAQTVVPPETTINCAYNLSLPTLQSGQMGRVQCDGNGSIIVSGQTSSSGIGVITALPIAPSNGVTYTANTAIADPTPVVGGTSFPGVCRTAGGSALITNLYAINNDPNAVAMQGELYLFDSAVTAIANNAAFSVSDTDMGKFVGKIPFTLATDTVVNASATISGLNLTVTCVGTTALRGLVKFIGASATYTTASDSLLLRLGIQ